MLTNDVRSSFGTHRAPSRAAAVTRGGPDHGGVDDGLNPHRASDFLT